ncbi:MAG TPA: EF-hand domain-containing protein [Pirellulales bacterium]|nr:EF-hand domain-containing protein [Pirellulales bacterium]
MKCCQWLHRLLACGVLLAASSVPALAAGDESDSADRNDKLFKQLDKNGDGEIAADELGPDQQRILTRLVRTSDKNSDGKLSRDEFLAGMKDAPPPREPGAGGLGRGGAGRSAPTPEQLEMIFKQLDKNGDGKVVIDEVPDERRERFTMMIERADADGDKSITLVEFTKGFAMAREEQAAADGGSQSSSRPQTPPGSGPAMGPGEAIYRGLDTNSDGKLSKDEIEAAPKSLEKLDRNSDGEITREELGGPRSSMAQAGRPGGQPGSGDGRGFFKQIDKNGDGKVSKDEAPERMKESFDKLDSNGDGFIEESEFARVMQGMGRRPGGPGGPPGQGKPGQGGPGQRPDAKQMLERMDSNKDGKLSKDEWPERMQENFDKFDANSDGSVDADELERGFAAMGGNRPGQPGGRRRPSDGDNKDNKDSKDNK